MLKADLHIHTLYSMDCQTSLEDIIKACGKAEINCIAVSDHGTAEGALQLEAGRGTLVVNIRLILK